MFWPAGMLIGAWRRSLLAWAGWPTPPDGDPRPTQATRVSSTNLRFASLSNVNITSQIVTCECSHAAGRRICVLPSHFISCHVMLLHSLYVVGSHVTSSHVMCCHVKWSHVMAFHVMACYVMLFHVMSCYAMLSHVMSCHVIPFHLMHVIPCIRGLARYALVFKRPPTDAAAPLFFEILDKIGFFENWSKSALGSILGRFGIEFRILREKLHRDISSNRYFMISWKPGYL